MNSKTSAASLKPAHIIPKPVWVSTNEAIRISGIGRTRLYELIADGTLKSVKLGGKRLISFASIEALGQ